jgi:hypothetical protein
MGSLRPRLSSRDLSPFPNATTPCSHRSRGHVPRERIEQAHARAAGHIRDAAPSECSPSPLHIKVSPMTDAPYVLCFTSCQYGKSMDWKREQWTTHDVASVFRRYLTQMPVRLPSFGNGTICVSLTTLPFRVLRNLLYPLTCTMLYVLIRASHPLILLRYLPFFI